MQNVSVKAEVKLEDGVEYRHRLVLLTWLFALWEEVRSRRHRVVSEQCQPASFEWRQPQDPDSDLGCPSAFLET